MSLLQQPRLSRAETESGLAELRGRARHRAALGLALAVAGLVLLLSGHGQVGIPLLIGAGAAGLLVGFAREDRRRLLIRLVAQDDDWQLAEVRRAADRLVSAAERRRLARGLTRAAEAVLPRVAEFSVVDPHRVAVEEARMRRLAAAIGDPEVPLRPPGAALCRRFLSDGRLSPLYNPRVDEAELERVLGRIETAIGWIEASP